MKLNSCVEQRCALKLWCNGRRFRRHWRHGRMKLSSAPASRDHRLGDKPALKREAMSRPRPRLQRPVISGISKLEWGEVSYKAAPSLRVAKSPSTSSTLGSSDQLADISLRCLGESNSSSSVRGSRLNSSLQQLA
jgi:hypothetical protein